MTSSAPEKPQAKTKRKPEPLPVQLAQVSWIAPLAVIAVNRFLSGSSSSGESAQAVIFTIFAVLLHSAGFACGVAALFFVRKHGRKGILIPAIIGIVLSGSMLVFIGFAFNSAVERNSPSAKMEAFVEGIQAELPQEIEPGLELTRVESTEGQIQYHYSLTDLTSDQIDVEKFNSAFREPLNDYFCNQMAFLWENDFTLLATYTAADGVAFSSLKFSREGCPR